MIDGHPHDLIARDDARSPGGAAGPAAWRFRELDTSLGRWTRQDPAGYIDGASLVQGYIANPVKYVDQFGLEIGIDPDDLQPDNEYDEPFKEQLDQLKRLHPRIKKGIEVLEDSDFMHDVYFVPNEYDNPAGKVHQQDPSKDATERQGSKLIWSVVQDIRKSKGLASDYPNDNLDDPDVRRKVTLCILAHEIQHMLDLNNGDDTDDDAEREARATRTENFCRSQLGLDEIDTYNGTPVSNPGGDGSPLPEA